MVYMTLTKEMEDMLKSIINSTFISYERDDFGFSAYGNLRINTDKTSIELTNLEKAVPFIKDEEEVAGFECQIVDKNTKFNPYCIIGSVEVKVDSLIKEIEIVNDFIYVNDGKYEISFDQAIIIKTETKTIMFSRDAWFSEDIVIYEHDDYDSVYPVSDERELFENEDMNKVKVTRTRRKL